MNLFAIPNMIAGILSLLVGFFVFSRNYKSPVNISFLILTLSASLWQIGNSILLFSSNLEVVFTWSKIVYWGAIFIPVATYHFVISFLGKKSQIKYVILSYIISAFVFLPLIETGYIVGGLNRYYWGYWFQAGTLHPLFLVFFASLMVISFANLYTSYKQESLPLQKTRIKFLLISFIIAYIGSVDYLANYGIKVYPFGYLPVFIFLSLITYAIMRYRLMETTIAVTRTGIFVAVYAIVLGLPFVIAGVFSDKLNEVFGKLWWALPLGIMGGLAIIGPFVYMFLNRKAEARLLKEQRNYQETLKQASLEMTRIHNLQKLLDMIVEIVTKTVQISNSAIYLLDGQSGQFLLKAVCDTEKAQLSSISDDSTLVTWLQEHQQPLVYEEIKRQAQEGRSHVYQKLEEDMRTTNAAVVVPGFLEEKLLYILILGDKRSGRVYTSDDLSVFSILTSQTALGIDNARLYENMEEEVRQRTNELVQMESQLIQAEKLATVGTLAGGVAHEINNPLAAILANAQMLLESETIHDASDKESLQLIEMATQRCRDIVIKLMDYSRKPIKPTGESRVDLIKVINNVVALLNYQLEQENIRIVTNIKEQTSYVVAANQNELEQALTNIVLNARDAVKKVKNSGNVYVSLVDAGDRVSIDIRDEGIGIPKEVTSRIFDPFFTTKDVGKGLGLGLSICQAIIERHNGQIAFESEFHQGSTFTITLPKTNK